MTAHTRTCRTCAAWATEPGDGVEFPCHRHPAVEQPMKLADDWCLDWVAIRAPKELGDHEALERVAWAIWGARRKGRLRGQTGLHLTWDEIANPEAHDINPFRLTELAADIRDEARAAIAAMEEAP